MISILKLFVYSSELGHLLLVKINKSETVYELKEAILQESPNILKDIDAGQLNLYVVDLLDDEHIAKAAEEATEGQQPLKSSHSLARVFETVTVEPEPERIKEGEDLHTRFKIRS
ncbi:hypothetical protein F5148DRAFT_1353028 [Russula earlei]|uniref:Uncharacterized protein n=1 Tax=Russula earlei TaxID=71964 RepID=A0ACC0UA81_9AGAM|nr:hypothetical protein F5148DRAFT_1353028 [Russula earlei]